MTDKVVTESSVPIVGLNGNSNGWMGVVSKYGVPSAIALFLIWWLTAKVDTELSSVKATLIEHSSITTSTTISMQNFAAEQRQVQRDIAAILRRICVNSAKTDAQREECVR